MGAQGILSGPGGQGISQQQAGLFPAQTPGGAGQNPLELLSQLQKIGGQAQYQEYLQALQQQAQTKQQVLNNEAISRDRLGDMLEQEGRPQMAAGIRAGLQPSSLDLLDKMHQRNQKRDARVNLGIALIESNPQSFGGLAVDTSEAGVRLKQEIVADIVESTLDEDFKKFTDADAIFDDFRNKGIIETSDDDFVDFAARYQEILNNPKFTELIKQGGLHPDSVPAQAFHIAWGELKDKNPDLAKLMIGNYMLGGFEGIHKMYDGITKRDLKFRESEAKAIADQAKAARDLATAKLREQQAFTEPSKRFKNIKQGNAAGKGGRGRKDTSVKDALSAKQKRITQLNKQIDIESFKPGIASEQRNATISQLEGERNQLQNEADQLTGELDKRAGLGKEQPEQKPRLRKPKQKKQNEQPESTAARITDALKKLNNLPGLDD